MRDQEALLVASARRRIGRGLAANLFGNGLTITIQLVSVPLLLGAWGVHAYGDWLVLSAIPVYLTLSDFGIATAAGSSMAMLEARSARDEAVGLGRQAWFVSTAATVLVLVAIAVTAGLLIEVSPTSTGISRIDRLSVLGLLLAQVAVVNQFSMLDAWYRTAGRYPLGVSLRQLSRCVEFGLIVLATAVGGGPVAAAFGWLAGSLIGFIASLVVLHRTIPWIRLGLEFPRRATIRNLVAPSLALLSFPLSNAISIQGALIVVGSIFGSTAVVVFSTTRTITRIAVQLINSVNLSVWPELSRAIGAGRWGEARSIQRRAVQLSIGCACVAAAGLAAFGSQAIQWWTHGVVNPPASLLLLLVLVVVTNSLWFTLTTGLAASNQLGVMALVYVVTTVLGLALALPLGTSYGLAGVALALLLIDITMTIYVFPTALRALHDDPGPFIRSLFTSPKGLGRTRPRGEVSPR